MSLRIDTAEWISGSLLIGETGLGVLGSAIPSTGDNGAGYAYNDLSLPADSGKEICGRITTWPYAGTLFAYEDTSFTFTAPDGSYSFDYQLYVDGVATGSPTTVSLTVGTVNGSATASVSSLSILAPSASAVGTSTADGLGAGNVSSITIDAVSAVGIGTSAGNGIGAGTPSAISIGTVTASATGTTQANGAATGAPSVFTMSAPSAVAGVFIYVRAPSGSGPSVIKPTSRRVSNIYDQARPASVAGKRG